MRKLFVFLVSAVVAAPAIAALPAQSSGAGAQPAAQEKKVLCKKEANTGTRFAEKKCLTKAQWDKIIEQQKREAKEMIDRPLVSPPGN